MYMVTVTDSVSGVEYTYDADMQIQTADDGLAFFTSQLSVLESRIYETKYQNIMFQEFVPVDTSDPEWVDAVTYISYDAVTMGKFIAANGKDLPESDINASKSTIPVFYGGIAARWSLDELRKSQQLRMPIDTTKASANYRGYQEHQQQVAYFGDSDRGVTGLFNNDNVAETSITIDFSSASGTEITKALNEVINDVYESSAQVHVPNMMLIPQSIWQYMLQPVTSVSDMTVLEYYKANNMSQSLGVTLNIRPVYQLNDIGTNSTGRVMAYEMNNENLVMKSPMPYRTIAPQPEGLTVKVPAEYKFGGVEFRYPGSAVYADLPA